MTVEIDTRRYEVRVDGQPVQITARPFQVLLALAEDPGRLYRKVEIEQRVWGAAMHGRALDVQVKRLREAIGPDAIRTVRGVGYSLEAEGRVTA